MITLYYDLENDSVRNVIRWLELHHIALYKKRIQQLSQAELIQILILTENGFTDIMKDSSRIGNALQAQVQQIEMMNFDEAVNFVSKHLNLLKTPLIIGEGKLVTGYNKEKLKRFIHRV